MTEGYRVTKNIIIFSDGTGQAGGFRFDEARTNIYKMFRASRCGPNLRLIRASRVRSPTTRTRFAGGRRQCVRQGSAMDTQYRGAEATGFGITRNLIYCYAALIQLWRPGDRIFLLGFSRGAYTVRCLAGIIGRCGIPTHADGNAGTPIKLDDDLPKKFAAETVKHVYQFTEPLQDRPSNATPKVSPGSTGELIAAHSDAVTAAPILSTPDTARIYPYFVGVFDTVAALGNLPTFLLFFGSLLQPSQCLPA